MRSASHRAERSNERAIEIRVRALQESVGARDELVDGVDFFPAISAINRSMFRDMEDVANKEGEETYEQAARRLLAVLEARVARRNGFLQEQVTGRGEQGEEPTQPRPDAVQARGSAGRMR